MQIDIDGLSEDELIDLNHRIIARLQLLQQMRTHEKMLDFSLGQRVWFQPEGRPRIHGVIMRYNKKTITVITDNGEHWKVSPAALNKATDPAKSPTSGNVIPLHRK